MAKKQTNQESKYCTLRFNVRATLFISCAEYCFCDIVYHLQNNPNNKDGWANAKLDYYADMIGVSKRGVEKMRDRMIDKGLIDKKDGQNNDLKITSKWYKSAIEGYVKKIETKQEKEKPKTNIVHTLEKPKTNIVPTKDEQSSTKDEQSSKHTLYIIIIDNDIYNNKDEIIEKLKTETIWIEQIRMNKKLTEENFFQLLSEFLDEKIICEQLPKKMKDLKANFFHWIKFQKVVKVPKKEKTEKRNSDYVKSKKEYGNINFK